MNQFKAPDVSHLDTLKLPAVRQRTEIDYGVLLNIVLLAAWGVVLELLIWGVLKVSFL